MKDRPWLAIALAILVVVAIRLSTPLIQPMNDGMEYLKVAYRGLDPEAQLGAPFVYRFAVPLTVHAVSLLTGADSLVIFPVVVFIACVALLVAVYLVALLSGASREHAILILVLVASSVFVIRFPLYHPYSVDVEALLVAFGAFVFLLQRSYGLAAAVSLLGLLFKEFMLAPVLALIGLFFAQYLRDKSIRPLWWTLLVIVLALVVFLLPRLLIPITYGFGASLKIQARAPSQTMYLSDLRTLLSWPPRLGVPVNLLLALVSFWLPALMLMTRSRWRSVWQALESNRIVIVLWTVAVLALALVGGTNIMIFVTYSAPVLVLLLSLLMRGGISKPELVVTLVATVVFNRMIFATGAAGADLDLEIGFYGAFWWVLGSVTAWRFAEVAAWIVVAWMVRHFSPYQKPLRVAQ
jgi:hypothetical protein